MEEVEEVLMNCECGDHYSKESLLAFEEWFNEKIGTYYEVNELSYTMCMYRVTAFEITEEEYNKIVEWERANLPHLSVGL